MKISNIEVKEKAQKLGARFTGIGSVDRWKTAPVNLKPENVLPAAKSVIVIGVPIPRGMVETIPSHLWAREHGHLMGSKVDEITDELAVWLEDQNAKSTPIGGLSIAKSFMEDFSKALNNTPYPTYDMFTAGGLALNRAAVLTGVGTLGKSGNLLVEGYGPNVILGAVVTTAEIEPDPIINHEICNNCNKCIELCPGGAISKEGTPGNPVFDAKKCWLTNAMEGRTVKAALDKGDKAVADFLIKTIFMQTDATPATCICGAGCLVACPKDSRIRKLR